MSCSDPKQEFYGEIDDWWCQLFALRVGAKPPSNRIKQRFILFVEEQCTEVGCWEIKDNELSSLFSDFIDRLGDW